MKAGAAPKPKSNPKPESFDKPKAKAVWKKDKPAGPRTDAPRSDAKPAADKPYKARAADPSKRFVPPNKLGKAGGKPKGGKPAGGGEGAPQKPKTSFRPK
jgi:ATP-dependent RNA helicase DeaD